MKASFIWNCEYCNKKINSSEEHHCDKWREYEFIYLIVSFVLNNQEKWEKEMSESKKVTGIMGEFFTKKIKKELENKKNYETSNL